MTKTVVWGALTLNQVTLKLYAHGLVPWEGFKSKKKSEWETPPFCKVSPSYTPIIFKSLCSFVGGSVAAICWNFNQHGGNSTCNKKELVLIVSSASVCRGHGPGLTRPNVWHPFLSTNKSVSKMLLAQDCLPNWDLMRGPHGNRSGYDPDERRSLASFSLSLSFQRVIAFAGNEYWASNSLHQCHVESSSSSQFWSCRAYCFPHSNTLWVQEEAFN